jgi:hypothetical protein
MTERFIVDDAGTLIDMETRNTYDYVDEVIDILNQQNNTIKTYKTGNILLKTTLNKYKNENQQIRDTIKEMYNNERTYIGKSTLKQLLEQIQ